MRCACNPGACRRGLGENSISMDRSPRSSLLSDRLHACAACGSYWLLLLTIMFHMMRQMRVNALLLSKLTSSNWISECLDSRRAHSMPCVHYCTPIRSIQHVLPLTGENTRCSTADPHSTYMYFTYPVATRVYFPPHKL